MSIEAMYGLIEMVFFYSIAIGFGIWQLVKTRRELARDRASKAEEVKEGPRAVRSISSGKYVKTD